MSTPVNHSMTRKAFHFLRNCDPFTENSDSMTTSLPYKVTAMPYWCPTDVTNTLLNAIKNGKAGFPEVQFEGPNSEAAVVQHIKRAQLLATILEKALDSTLQARKSTDFGFKEDLTPTSFIPVSEFIMNSCKTNCNTGRCRCCRIVGRLHTMNSAIVQVICVSMKRLNLLV